MTVSDDMMRRDGMEYSGDSCDCEPEPRKKTSWFCPDRTPFGGPSEYTHEYMPWPMSKVHSYRPPNSCLDQNTPMSGMTTYGKDYCPKEPQAHINMPKGKYCPPNVPMDGKTTYRNDYPGCPGGREKSYKPHNKYCAPLVPMDAPSIYRRSYRGYNPGEMKDSKPENMRPRGCASMSNVPMNGISTFMNDYRPWGLLPKVQPFGARGPYCKSDIPFAKDTTYHLDYVKQPICPQPSCKGPSNYCPPQVPFAGLSTFTNDYRYPGPVRTGNYKPLNAYCPPTNQVDGRTTYNQAYMSWGSRIREIPPWAIKKPYCPPNAPVQGDTIYRDSYRTPCGGSPALPYRPPHNRMGDGGPMSGRTTYTVDYENRGGGPSESCRPNRSFCPPQIPMDGLTTMRKDYRGCPASPAEAIKAGSGFAERCMKPLVCGDYNTIYNNSYKDPFDGMPCLAPKYKKKSCNYEKCPRNPVCRSFKVGTGAGSA